METVRPTSVPGLSSVSITAPFDCATNASRSPAAAAAAAAWRNAASSSVRTSITLVL